jgi:ankyrin repeat protein
MGFDDLFDPDKPYFDIWRRLRNEDSVYNSSISLGSSESSPDTDDLGDNTDESRSDSKKASPDLDPSPANSDQSRSAHPPYYSRGLTPLHCVVRSEHFSRAEYLVSKRPQDQHVRFMDFTPSHWAVFGEDIKISRRLLQLSVDVDAKSMKGRTTLHLAARSGRVELIRMLVERHAAINARDYKGRTPLYLAMYEAGDESDDEPDAFGCAQFLLEHGAGVDAQDKRGPTPLHRATYKTRHQDSPTTTRAWCKHQSTESQRRDGPIPIGT